MGWIQDTLLQGSPGLCVESRFFFHMPALQRRGLSLEDIMHSTSADADAMAARLGLLPSAEDVLFSFLLWEKKLSARSHVLGCSVRVAGATVVLTCESDGHGGGEEEEEDEEGRVAIHA